MLLQILFDHSTSSFKDSKLLLTTHHQMIHRRKGFNEAVGKKMTTLLFK